MLFHPLGTILVISLTALATFSTACSIDCPEWLTLIALQSNDYVFEFLHFTRENLHNGTTTMDNWC